MNHSFTHVTRLRKYEGKDQYRSQTEQIGNLQTQTQTTSGPCQDLHIKNCMHQLAFCCSYVLIPHTLPMNS